MKSQNKFSKQMKQGQGKKKAPTNEQLDKKIKAMKQEIELKYVDFPSSGAINTLPASQIVNIVNTGLSATARIGNAIKGSSLQLSYWLLPFATETNPVRCRVILYWDRQANGALPGVIGSASTNALLVDDGTADPTMAPYNVNTRARYKVLYDKVHVLKILDAGSAPITRDMIMVNKKYFKTSRNIRYDGTGGGISDIATNSLCLSAFSNVVGANGPTLTTYSRFYYKDA